MSGWTEADYQNHLTRLKAGPAAPPAAPKKIRQPRVGYRSKTEEAYAKYLDTLRATNVIDWWMYEPITFKLAPGCSYTPDFVYESNGNRNFVEVKGRKGHKYFSRDLSKAKVRIAADKFRSFGVFEIVWPSGVGWERLNVGA